MTKQDIDYWTTQDEKSSQEFLKSAEDELEYKFKISFIDQTIIKVDDEDYSGTLNIYEIEYKGMTRIIGIECYMGKHDSAFLKDTERTDYIDDGTSTDEILRNAKAWFERQHQGQKPLFPLPSGSPAHRVPYAPEDSGAGGTSWLRFNKRRMA